MGLVTPASLATVSMVTEWKPWRPKTFLATSRSWARRSAARIRRRDRIWGGLSITRLLYWRRGGAYNNLPTGRKQAGRCRRHFARRNGGISTLRGPDHAEEVGERVRREGDPGGGPRVRRDGGVPLAGGEEGRRAGPVLHRLLPERRRGPHGAQPPHRPGGDGLGVRRDLPCPVRDGAAAHGPGVPGDAGAADRVGPADDRDPRGTRGGGIRRHRARCGIGRLRPCHHGPPRR